MDEIVEKWENSGLLFEYDNKSNKIELSKLFEEMYEHIKNNETDSKYLNNIRVAMFPAIVRVYRKHGKPFNVLNLYDAYLEFMRQPTTRDAIDDMRFVGIDYEAELLSVFCDAYEPEKTIDPKKIIKKFKL